MAAVMTGVDPHKASHTAVIISAAEQELGELRVRACAAQAEQLLGWAAAWPQRTWAAGGAGGLGHPDTGYRRYGTGQIAPAQVIRRFRDLDMPLEEIHAVLSAPDPHTRSQLISDHLARLEASLARTQDAVATLRDLLERPAAAAPVRHRHAAAVPAAAITEIVDRADALAWYQGALGELHATLAAQGVTAAGPGGGIYQTELFTEEQGEATIFLPCQAPPRPMGRAAALDVPAAELATVVHAGPHAGIDLAYGTLAAYVTRHALAVDGPIREYYLTGPADTPD